MSTVEKQIANRKLYEKLHSMGFSMRKTKPITTGQSWLQGYTMTIEGTGSHVAEFMQWARSDSFTESFAKDTEVKAMKEHLTGREESKFRGGSYSDLLGWLNGSVDMTPYKKERDRLQKTGFDRKIREKIAMVSPRRTRYQSEHDGEWSLDRKWDTTPFQSTRKAMGAGRTIDILVNLCANAGVESHHYDRFGTMVWAVSDLIESAGIQTRITARYATRSVGSDSDGSNINAEVIIRLKEPTQFVTPVRLAACFKTAFFRRPIFSLFHATTQLENGCTEYGLGQADSSGYPIKFLPETGKLTMTIGTSPVDVLAMEKEILAAIDATVKGVGAA